MWDEGASERVQVEETNEKGGMPAQKPQDPMSELC